MPAAQPSAIVWDRPVNRVFVAAAGSDAVLALSPNGLRTNLKAAAVKSANEIALPASHLRVSASQPRYSR